MTAPRRPPDLSKSMLADLPMETSCLADGATAGESDGFAAGRVVAGRYKLQERLGSGGIGSVWGAHDSTTGDDVAIKIMKPGLVEQPEARKRFIKEALLARKMTHEGIVRVYDVQEAEGELLIVMERLHGESLGQRLKKINEDQQLMGVEAALKFTLRIGEILSYLHRQNVIHCDIKPDNVWINKDGGLKLLDFGISRALGHTLFQTMLHRAGGTAYYMAPEQFDSKRVVDPRADQYSLAVMLYEMLTGRIPMGRFKPVEQIRSEVGEALSEVIMTALNEAPEERYPDMSVFCAQLESRSMGATHQNPLINDGLREVYPEHSRGTAPILSTDREKVGKDTEKSNKATWYVGLLVAFLLGGGAYLWSGKGSKPDPVSAPAPAVAMEEVKKDAVAATSAPQIEMVAIPGRNYELGRTEVTVAQYLSCVQAGGCSEPEWREKGKYHYQNGSEDHYRKLGAALTGENYPIVGVSWHNAQQYVKWLSQQTGQHYRLPTEAEWEYACYGGSKTEYCGGDNLDAVGWYVGNSGNKTHAAGRKQANSYGLYDMSGNVWEWMEDCYDSSCGSRVLRGGSWGNKPASLRAVYRIGRTPGYRHYGNGFRVAR